MKLGRKVLGIVIAGAFLAGVSVVASANEPSVAPASGQNAIQSQLPQQTNGGANGGIAQDEALGGSKASTNGSLAGAKSSKDAKTTESAKSSSSADAGKSDTAAKPTTQDLDMSCNDTTPHNAAEPTFMQEEGLQTAQWTAAPTDGGGCVIHIYDGTATLAFLPWNTWPARWVNQVTDIVFTNVTIYNPMNDLHGQYRASVSGMLRGLSKLKTVDVSGLKFRNDTGYDVQMQKMFAEDPKLEQIKGLSSLDTSHVGNMSQLFAGDASLTELDLSSWDTSRVQDMAEMFSGASSLRRVNLSGWDTSRLGQRYENQDEERRVSGSLNAMFANDTALQTVDMTGWKTGAVHDYTDMFSSCSSLKTVKGIEDVSWTQVPAGFVQPGDDDDDEDDPVDDSVMVSDMFKGDKSLERIDLSKWDTRKVTDVSGMFSGATKLRRVNVRGWDVSAVADFSGMFDGASSLNAVDGINDWTMESSATKSGRSMADMFAGTAFTSLDLSRWKTGKVTDMSGMFSNAKSLTNVKFADWDLSQATNVSRLFAGDTAMQQVDLHNWNAPQVTDMSYLFANQSDLKKVDITGWNTPSLNNVSYMFLGDGKLNQIKGLADLDTSNVTDMSGMFASVNQLSKLPAQPEDTAVAAQDDSEGLDFGAIAHWNVGKVQKFDQMFMGRADLDKLDLSHWKLGQGLVRSDPSATVSVRAMFAGDTALTGVKGLSSWKTGDVSDMSYLFYQCQSLDGLGDLSGWDTSRVANMEGMFRYDTSLKNVRGMKDWDTSQVTSMAGMFQRNRKRTDLTDVSGWKTDNVSQMWDMFGGDSNLKHIDVSGWNTANVKSMTYMFQGTGLKTLDLSGWNTMQVADVPTENLHKCAENKAVATDGTCKILPENLEEITVGDATKLQAESFSDDPADTDGYTGGWTSDDDSWASGTDDANADLANHLTAGMTGAQGDSPDAPHSHTYRWQERAALKFDANLPKGVTLQGTLPQNVTALGAHVNQVQHEIPAADLKADGYEFMGWNTTYDGNEDGTGHPGKPYKAGDTVVLSRGRNITLYAQWKAVDVPEQGHYVMHYEANAPKGFKATGTMNDDAFDVVYTKKSNKLYQQRALAESDFAVDGYRFIGWSKKAAGGEDTPVYRPGTKLNVKPGVTTFFAHWRKVTGTDDSSANHQSGGSVSSVQVNQNVVAAGGLSNGIVNGQGLWRDGVVGSAPAKPKTQNGQRCVPRPASAVSPANGIAWYGTRLAASLPYCEDSDVHSNADQAVISSKSARVIPIMVTALVSLALLLVGLIAIRLRFAPFASAMASRHRRENRDE
ncbi:BspA family leucine-rich repeat surface protein [Bifidobacterium sp. ESL0732]|uniref:BspA family leucine-rich repeat surface protein n=1 Tax=Bifidobacterium sp. ESL0732 TaxID=2983222 RepID=UPI0023F926D6|nr:BspA family leucine-rich repeat surface protein [Bifidobacterium sp. ESL0732]WEV63928.1 BspA family leucine-rich repeat surface protein [Bifidobacterium sp. ESL0732]